MILGDSIVRPQIHGIIITVSIALTFLVFLNFIPYQSGTTLTVDSLKIPLRGAVVLSVGPDGDLFVIEREINTIIRCSKIDGSYEIIANYSWKDAADNYPRDVISVNGLDIYVADYSNHRVLRFDQNLNFISAYPSDEQSSRTGRVFGYPKSVGVDRFGSLYVLDGENNRIVKMGRSNAVERTFGGYDAGKGRIRSPRRVRVSIRDLVFVQDQNQIVVFDIFGNYIRTIGTDLFSSLKTFTLDGGTIYAFDDCKVFVISEQGVTEDTILVRQLIPGYDCTDVADMDVKQGVLYLLGEQSLVFSRIGNTSLPEIK